MGKPHSMMKTYKRIKTSGTILAELILLATSETILR